MINRTLGHYRVLRRLGTGGMGIVYEAEDTKLGRKAALKFLPADLTRDPKARARFLIEARATSKLDQPNICTVYEIGETDDGQDFIAMAYYEGETLEARLERGPLSVDVAVDIARQVAQGLAKAHEHEICHRDIKPANIFLTDEGVAKIIDFGIARLSSSSSTHSSELVGTVAYMAPELIEVGEFCTATDLWSLGAVIYEMLSGVRPFQSDHPQNTMYSIVHKEPIPLEDLRPGLDARLQHIVNRLLQKSRSDRYATANELLADLLSMSDPLPDLLTLHELQHFLKTVPIGLCHFDKDLRYLRINDCLAGFNGSSAEEHLGRTFSEVVPEVAARLEHHVRHILDSGEPIMNLVVTTPTPAHPTTPQTYLCNFLPSRSADGTVIGVFGVVQDITTVKNELLEAALADG